MFKNSHFPFLSKEFRTNVKYPKGLCPTAERMYQRELLVTTIFQPPNTKNNIDEFINTIEKIEKHVELLREYEQKD